MTLTAEQETRFKASGSLNRVLNILTIAELLKSFGVYEEQRFGSVAELPEHPEKFARFENRYYEYFLCYADNLR